METLHGLDALKKLPPKSVLSIGNFDGVHLGHRRILQTARQLATDTDARFAVVTFEPHPLTVIRPEHAPLRLTTSKVKQLLLQEAGADYLIVLPPEPEILNLQAEQFWKILRDDVRAAHLVEGPGFRFGKGAAGSIELLAQWAANTSVALHVVEFVRVPLLNLQVVNVSSSLIRFLLRFGRVRDAAICLGRPYLITGLVGKGFARGRELGVPTANLKCDDQQIPPDGVYAARCNIDGKNYPAAVSIGTMPTFGQNVRQIEAHLVGFSGDLYGRQIGVELFDWLREQRKFSGPQPLVEQMDRDIAQTRILAATDPSRMIATILA